MPREREPDFFAIDPNELDREWVRQPGLYHKYATDLADARREFEQAKTQLEIAAADVDSVIRSKPEKFGIEKVTEAAVKAAVLASREYKAATDAVHNARHAVDVLQAAVTTLDHRKKALENLVDLRLANYFSEPRAGSPRAREHMEEKTKQRARRGDSDD